MEVKRTSLCDKSSPRNCYIRILLLITVLFMTGFGLSPIIPHYPPSPPSNVSIQTRLIDHFHLLIFLHLCCVIYFKFLFLFYLILFLSFQNSTLFGVGGGRLVNSFTSIYIVDGSTSILKIHYHETNNKIEGISVTKRLVPAHFIS